MVAPTKRCELRTTRKKAPSSVLRTGLFDYGMNGLLFYLFCVYAHNDIENQAHSEGDQDHDGGITKEISFALKRVWVLKNIE